MFNREIFANNKYMREMFDAMKPVITLFYVDATSLYPTVLQKPLPVGKPIIVDNPENMTYKDVCGLHEKIKNTHVMFVQPKRVIVPHTPEFKKFATIPHRVKLENGTEPLVTSLLDKIDV